MGNLKVLSVEVIDNSNISAKFTEKLSTDINTTNILIKSEMDGIPSPSVLSVEVYGYTLNINIQPITPSCPYSVYFKSSDSAKFESLNGQSILDEYDVSNNKIIIGPIEQDNPSKRYLTNFLQDNIYNVTDTSSNIYKYIQALSYVFSKSFYDIKQLKNDNYISFVVTDELKTRGNGPFDRLNEEGAYEILRVSSGRTGEYYLETSLSNYFSSDKITLQSSDSSDSLTPASFNRDDFILNLNKQNIIKLDSLVFTYTDGRYPFTYEIDRYGYHILDPSYDSEKAFKYYSIKSNQIKISKSIIDSPGFSLSNLDRINVSYKYKNLGRIIEPTSVAVHSIMKSIREELPPLMSVFNLKRAHIINEFGNDISIGGIKFIDMDSYDLSGTHPAFKNEIPYNNISLPSNPGEYAIDYANGTVYVYGESNLNPGTGPRPPLATYYYKFTYKDSVDYVYDSSSADLAAIPNGNLIGTRANITFKYEDVFVNGVDYKANVHEEIINERIGNRISSDGSIKVDKSQITNVFKIFNETSGEFYAPLRWNGNRVYYSYNVPPKFNRITSERASFFTIKNEPLIVENYFNPIINSNGLSIFKCYLQNRNITSASEDSIGSSVNSSAIFSNKAVFKQEKWFDRSFGDYNLNNIFHVGEYQIDYINGVIYVAVDPRQDRDIGSISYKNSEIQTSNKHITNVNDIFYSLNGGELHGKSFNYTSFSDSTVNVIDIDFSDETNFENDSLKEYRILSNNVAYFSGSSLMYGVSQDVKSMRGIYEFNDLKNNSSPINFAANCLISGKNVRVQPVKIISREVIFFDGTDYFINVPFDAEYLSPSIDFNALITRASDGSSFSYSITPGKPIKIILTSNSPSVNDVVDVVLTISISDYSRIILDYNKGDFYIDYVHLADEILVSYEHGDNVIDFRESNRIKYGDKYFVSYRVGALRDALINNFGTLINIPELMDPDVDLNRERYRDAISAVMESLNDGPTITNIKNVVKKMSHVDPEIKESVFNGWSLGSSLLAPKELKCVGDVRVGSGKYNAGAFISKSGESIIFPMISNIRLESGTFQSWIIPRWDGIDNDADIEFYITHDGSAYPSNKIFIGAFETHPNYSKANSFKLNKQNIAIGKPNFNKNGIYIYYDKDTTGAYYRWYVRSVNNSENRSFKTIIKASTDGFFFDPRVLSESSNSGLTTSDTSLIFDVSGSYGITRQASFVCDTHHYILDFGENDSKNRFSLYKDQSGLMNFRVYDNKGKSHYISHDVSDWKYGEPHNVAITWSLNSKNNQDEMHLFIDGLEVPNLVKFGYPIKTNGIKRFSSVNEEDAVGFIDKSIFSSNGLIVSSSTNIVKSNTTDFSVLDLNVGDLIFINEAGFNRSGYTISAIAGNTLTLSSTMPRSVLDARFTLNKKTVSLPKYFDNYSRFIAFKISPAISGNDLIVNYGFNIVTSSKIDFASSGLVNVGDKIRIYSGSFDKTLTINNIFGNNLVLNDAPTISSSSCNFSVYKDTQKELKGPKAVNPSYHISDDGKSITIIDDVKQNDLIIIKKLGLNDKRVVQRYFNWLDTNVFKTSLPTPISLNNTYIYSVPLPLLKVGNADCSSIVGSTFTTSPITVGNLSSADGRSLKIKISSNNIDFSMPFSIQINGLPASETIMLSSPSSIVSSKIFTKVNSVVISGDFLDSSKSFFTIEIMENLPITEPEMSSFTNFPTIRYSYQKRFGYDLFCNGGSDLYDSTPWYGVNVGDYISILNPTIHPGFYKIINISSDRSFITVDPPVNYAFTGGEYQVLNVSIKNSGFQNGFFTFEKSNEPGVPYKLPSGTYEFNYSTHLSIKIDPINVSAHLGSDRNLKNQIHSVLDEVKITANQLPDTRIGEIPGDNQDTITRSFYSLNKARPNKNTLLLSHFESLPFVNEAPFFKILKDKRMLQSGIGVNKEFDKSVIIKEDPLVIENNGILNPRNEGTIEFWVNPIFDTANDPKIRFYFDTSSVVIEDAVSISDSVVQLKGIASNILSIKLSNRGDETDYFDGGSIEFSEFGARVERILATNDYHVRLPNAIPKAAQILSVKLVGDMSNKDYFNGGSIGPDGRVIYFGTPLPSFGTPFAPHSNKDVIVTYKPLDGLVKRVNGQIIRLNKRLPYQNTKVTVTYIPSGQQGDRLSIYKDPNGFLNFTILATGVEHQVRAPIFWQRNSWHRVKAMFKTNSIDNKDHIRLFVDGYEYSNVTFGSGYFGALPALGSSFIGQNTGGVSIKVKDSFNYFNIGSNFYGKDNCYALVDNLRISNISRPVFAPFGESIDVNYNSNTDAAIPVKRDLYTTMILDFDSMVDRVDDFANLVNKKSGGSDFSINIFDSFGIVNGSLRVKEITEKLIKILKPANSRVFLKYF